MSRSNSLGETSDQIHIINPLQSLSGGGCQRALHIFNELKDHREVSLWSELKVNPKVAENYPVRQLVPKRFEFPQTGTFVFVGTYFPIGPWVRYASPRRTILIHNSNDLTPQEFRQKIWQLSNKGRRKVEVAYASELAKRLVDYPGFVQPSLIDLDKFVPAARSKPADLVSGSEGFTVGRLSRPAPKKHHPDDAAFYRRLVDQGCQVRIMGPSPSLKAQLEGLEESVELLPKGEQEAHLFLQGLDCFFYRTSEEWLEPSGRVITEAMACGLPVVCHKRGGYVEIIEHGRNGFLFDSEEEALEIVLRLKEDRGLRESVGKAARQTAEELFSAAQRQELVEFYLR